MSTRVWWRAGRARWWDRSRSSRSSSRSRNVGRRDHTHSARRELDGEGETVEPTDELGHVADDVRRGLEVGSRCTCSLEEQRHRRYVRVVGTCSRQPERGQRVDLLDREPEPLPAGGKHPDSRASGGDLGHQVTRGCQHVLAVV